MNNNFNKFLTDASIISAIVVYSYIVYLMGELGCLSSYGINNAISLIPIEIQGVIFGFLQGLFYFVMFMAVIVVITFPVALITKNYKVNSKNAGVGNQKLPKIVYFIVTSAAFFMIVPLLKDAFGFTLALFFYFSIIFIIFLVIYIKIPHTNNSLSDFYEIFFDRFIYQDSRVNYTKRLYILFFLIAVLLIPVGNYVNNYNNVSTFSYQSVKISKINGLKYVLVRQYGDKNIFVQIENEVLSPNYIIQKGESINNVAYSIEYRKLDNSALFPKSNIFIELKKRLWSIFNFK